MDWKSLVRREVEDWGTVSQEKGWGLRNPRSGEGVGDWGNLSQEREWGTGESSVYCREGAEDWESSVRSLSGRLGNPQAGEWGTRGILLHERE